MSGYRGRGRGNRRAGGMSIRGRGRGFGGVNVCHHYLNGSCNFGTRCRNYHPPTYSPPSLGDSRESIPATIATANPPETAGPTPRVGTGRGSGRGRALWRGGPIQYSASGRGNSRGRGSLIPRPSGNASNSTVAVNRIPDDALNTRAVPPDELSDDDDFLEDGEIDDESDLSVDYKFA